MEIKQKLWRDAFERRFLRATGSEFQSFVLEILGLRFPDELIPIAAAGSEGDLKNDGLLPRQRRLLQIYGPEGWNKRNALAKIEEDFIGAVKHWGNDFDTWTFVHNQVKGVPPYIQKRIEELSNSDVHSQKCEIWGFDRLRQITFELEDDDLQSLLGRPGTMQDLLSVEIKEIVPLLEAIEKMPFEAISEVSPVPPDKMEVNELPEDVVAMLQTGMRGTNAIRSYFRGMTTRPTYRDELGASFTQKYRTLRDDGHDANTIISALFEWIAGPSIGLSTSVHTATWAILAFFFEECDIFESGSAGPP